MYVYISRDTITHICDIGHVKISIVNTTMVCMCYNSISVLYYVK